MRPAHLLLVPLLAVPLGCGSADPTARPTPTTGASSGSPAPSYDVALVSGSAAGGSVIETGTPLTSAAAVGRYVATFRSPTFRADLRTRLDRAHPSVAHPVYAAVVAVGCDVPPGATARAEGAAVRIDARRIATTTPECVVPVTTVAVVTPA